MRDCQTPKWPQFTLPPAVFEGSNFSTSSTTIISVVFLLIVILVGVEWYPIVILIYISLVADDLKVLCLLALCISFLVEYQKRYTNGQETITFQSVRSSLHFELILYVVWGRVQLHSFACGYPVVLAPICYSDSLLWIFICTFYILLAVGEIFTVCSYLIVQN